MTNIYAPGETASGAPVNPLEDREYENPDQLYSDEDKEYLVFLQRRLENARVANDGVHPEFNNRTRAQYYEANEKIANTFLPEKKNDDDVIISSGTVEQKLDSLLSHVNNLNISTEIAAFDKENNRLVDLGIAIDDIVHDSEVKDGGDGGGDEEKKMLRQRELLKQGTVFVQEKWLRKFETKKKLKGDYNGEFKNFAGYSKKLELVFDGPSRELLYGLNVYLGDITQFYMENQPYVFVIQNLDYDVAKTEYGKFENWKYVRPGAVPISNANQAKTIYDHKWRLTELKDNQVEVILYQDQPNDEFQIIINGVCMLPIGFPLSAVTPMGKYNIVKQVNRVLNANFAFGGSFVSSGSIQQISAIIDEMLKLFVLKTRKSFTPAYVNTSGRVLDRKVLSPGRISMGFQASDLQPIGQETQGVSQGELGVIQELQGLLNKSTVSDQFTGQQSASGTTATEVVELQRQAKLTLGLTIAVCSLLEQKLGFARLHNILAHWFDPIDQKVIGDASEGKMKNIFRKTNRQVHVDGEGLGERMVIPTDEELPTPEVIRQMELMEESERGIPIRKIFIKADELKNAALLWYVNTIQKERESSATQKLLFRELVQDVILMMNLGSTPDREKLEEELARTWKKTKLFAPQQMQPMMAQPQAGMMPEGRPNQAGVPKVPVGE